MDEAKWCFVPTCLNSTRNTVNKWFVPIPVNPVRREEWFKAVNRNYCPNSERSSLYCCSDHFNLDEDAGSFFERDGEVVVKLKKTIVPRLSKQASDALRPISAANIALPNRTFHPSQTKPPALPPPHALQPDIVNLVDATSSGDDEVVDVVGVLASEPSDPRKAIAGRRMAGAGAGRGRGAGRGGGGRWSGVPPSAGKQGKTSARTRAARTPTTPTTTATGGSKQKEPVILQSLSSPSGRDSPVVGQVSKTDTNSNFPLLRPMFESLRKSIPSISSQPGLTRGQVLDEAIEFIIQMRNKSDRRQASMHYVMENNSALSAKIKHLENLLSLHEGNEIVLTREIIDRRLGAVAAQRLPPSNITTKTNKSKTKRKSLP